MMSRKVVEFLFVLNLFFLDFKFVSNLELRISDLRH